MITFEPDRRAATVFSRSPPIFTTLPLPIISRPKSMKLERVVDTNLTRAAKQPFVMPTDLVDGQVASKSCYSRDLLPQDESSFIRCAATRVASHVIGKTIVPEEYQNSRSLFIPSTGETLPTPGITAKIVSLAVMPGVGNVSPVEGICK
jgi:hypothetical protein